MINNNTSFDDLKQSLFSIDKSNVGRLKKLVFFIPFINTFAYTKCAKTCINLIKENEKEGLTEENKNDLNQTITGLKGLSEKIRKSHLANKKIRMQLDRQIIALSTRAGIRPASGEKTASQESVDVIKEACKKYKAHTYSIKDKELCLEDTWQINNLTTNHPRFLELLNADKQLRHQFFEWVILHKQPVDLFVKYTTINERIPDAAMRHIASGCKKNAFKVSSDGKLTLKCVISDEKRPGYLTPKYFNVLDPETKVPFTAEKIPTMNEILTQFPNASSAEREYQVFEDGLHFWSTDSYCGAHAPNGVFFDQKDWWNQLPTYKKLNLNEAKKRYGDVLDGKNWVMSPRSVHSSSDLDLSGNHSYLEVVIPNGDGSYNVYPFGRDPYRDPQGGLETLKFLTKTTYGRVIYADQGAYYTERRNTGISICLNQVQGETLMDNIKSDIADGFRGDLIFQLSGNNCAKWVQEKVDQITGDTDDQTTDRSIPNLFKVNAKEIKGPLFKGPKFLTRGLLTVLGAHRKRRIGEEELKLADTHIYKENVINHPTNMFKKLSSNELNSIYDVS